MNSAYWNRNNRFPHTRELECGTLIRIVVILTTTEIAAVKRFRSTKEAKTMTARTIFQLCGLVLRYAQGNNRHPCHITKRAPARMVLSAKTSCTAKTNQ